LKFILRSEARPGFPAGLYENILSKKNPGRNDAGAVRDKSQQKGDEKCGLRRGSRFITPAMSIRFGAFFGQSAEFWHGIQVECDFRALKGERKRLTAGIRSASELVKGE